MQKESFFTHHTLMELDKIKNLIFDFGGVLVDLDKARCLQAFARLGFTQAAGMIDAYSQQGLFGQLEEGTISPDHFCREVRRLTGIQVRDEDIWQAWNLFLVDIPAWKLEALIGLRKHFPIYLLSNTNMIHWQHAVNNLFPHGKWRVEDFSIASFSPTNCIRSSLGLTFSIQSLPNRESVPKKHFSLMMLRPIAPLLPLWDCILTSHNPMKTGANCLQVCLMHNFF